MVDPSPGPYRWHLPLGDSTFEPRVVPATAHLGSEQFDFVIFSVSSLQNFQQICALLQPHVHKDTLLVVELTGYVGLELFVRLSFPAFAKTPVCSIMNDADVKRGLDFHHRALGDHRLYLGTTSDLLAFTRFYKLLQLVQEDLKGAISLLKSTNAREFLTYQWKLALPRVVLDPLSVIFEQPYPQELAAQMLAKPLILGLINEVFKIIKKMDCKLVKGFENEANLIKNWLAYFSALGEKSSPVYGGANSLYYNFYHHYDLDIDLLLLQPILLGDDHGVRTPYLENLYLMICQLAKVNTGDSELFVRKTPGLESKMNELNVLTENVERLRLEKQSVDLAYQERTISLQQADAQITQKRQVVAQMHAEHESKARDYMAAHEEAEQRLAGLTAELRRKEAEFNEVIAKTAQQKALQVEEQKPVEEKLVKPEMNGSHREISQVQDTPDLSDLTQVAMYGAALNGELQPQAAPAQVPVQAPAAVPAAVHVPLQQDYVEDEQYQYQNQYQNQYQYQNQNQFPGQFQNNFQGPVNQNGQFQNQNYNQNYGFQGQFQPQMQGQPQSFNGRQYSQNHSLTSSSGFPPTGMPQNGMNGMNGMNGVPQNGSAQNLRKSQNFPQNFGYQNGQGPAPVNRRASSIPNSMRSYQDPQGHQMNQMNQMNQVNVPLNLQVNLQNPQLNPSMGQPQMNNVQNQQVPLQVQTQQLQGQGGYYKKLNRRSVFPMEQTSLTIDYGGRGGMPMPTSSANASGKHRSVGQSPTLQQQQQRKSVSGFPTPQGQVPSHSQPQPQPAPNHNLLRPPQGTSHSGLSNSVNEVSPKTATPENDIRLEVPLGLDKPVVNDEKKKKKKGFFKK